MFQFKCENCDTPETFLVDVKGLVTCGNCFVDGNAVELTAKQVKDLDLPKQNEA